MKEVALEKAVIAFLHHCVSAGDLKSCEALGVDIEAMKLIRDMDPIVIDRIKLVNRSPIIKKISLCMDSLQQLNTRVKRSKRIDAVIDSLLIAGATSTLINHYFPINRQEISNRRKLLGIELPKGRPERHPIVGKNAAILLQFLSEFREEDTLRNTNDPAVKCELMLKLVAVTNQPLEEIWSAILNAEMNGTLNW